MTILGPKKGLPTLAAAKLQRSVISLAAYQYDLVFRSTKEHCNADGFSQLPLDNKETVNCFTAMSVFELSQLEFLPVDRDRLRHATQTDPVLSQILHFLKIRWPDVVDPQLKPYANHQH